MGIALFHIHTMEVTGSNPVSPTRYFQKGLCFTAQPFFWQIILKGSYDTP